MGLVLNKDSEEELMTVGKGPQDAKLRTDAIGRRVNAASSPNVMGYLIIRKMRAF